MQALVRHHACMGAKRKRYTIRDVPASVDAALRRKAKHQGRSLNALALDALRAQAGIAAAEVEHHDLDAFVGTWVRDPETEAALADQRSVDERDWR
jgi:hypothetical protein